MNSVAERLILVGCNHDRTPLEIREKIALSREQVDLLMEQLSNHESIDEVLVLNTCNRVEIYALTNKSSIDPIVTGELCKLNQFDPIEFSHYAYIKSGIEAITHLFRVSAGLDSQLIGETEIFGQVKDAYQLSIQKKTVGKYLHRIFQKCFQAGKWARTHTDIGVGHVSIGNVSVDLASRIFGNLSNAKLMIIGSGDVGKDVAKAFRSRGIGQLSIASRTSENAEALAIETSGQVIPFKNWSYELALTDIAILATSARDVILTPKLMTEYLRKRGGKPIFLIDLALPRNVDTDCGKLEDCYLYNLDDLSTIARENLELRKAQIDICEAEIIQRATRLVDALAN